MYIYIYLLVGPTCQTCGAGLADKRARIANFFAREELPLGLGWCPCPCPRARSGARILAHRVPCPRACGHSVPVAIFRLDPSDFETTGPLECPECPCECFGPFGIIAVGVTDIEWLEGSVWITELLLVLLTVPYFFFMARKTALVDTSSRILKIVEVHSDVLVDLLVMLAVMFNVVAPSFALEGLPVIVVLVGEATWAAIGSWRG